jgi:hypothetical protein
MDIEVEELDRPAVAQPALPVAAWDHLKIVDDRLRAQGIAPELRRDVGKAIAAHWRAVTVDQERDAWHAMTAVARRITAALAALARRRP